MEGNLASGNMAVDRQDLPPQTVRAGFQIPYLPRESVGRVLRAEFDPVFRGVGTDQSDPRPHTVNPGIEREGDRDGRLGYDGLG